MKSLLLVYRISGNLKGIIYPNLYIVYKWCDISLDIDGDLHAKGHFQVVKNQAVCDLLSYECCRQGVCGKRGWMS